MENIRERIVSCADRVWFCAKELLKWLALAMITGVPCGIIGAAFDLAVEHVTELRTEHTAILFLLPVIGLVIVAFYKAAKLEGVSTDDMIDCVKDGKPIRFWLLPVMFISTVLTHLGGGSAGREGAALQMGGTIGWWAGGVLHLNVPTGGGKTLSALRYALAHAAKWNKSRIILTSSLLSILDQNAAVIRGALPDQSLILEHHSDVVRTKELERQPEWEMLCEQWSAPIVVTTLVQLLNTLFSGKTACIRRFQALADSIIVIDEVQTVPAHLLTLFNLAVNFLSAVCHATVVLCSATQPELERADHPICCAPAEMVPYDAGLWKPFDRTEIRYAGAVLLDNIPGFAMQKLEETDSLLIICNTKAEAQHLYAALEAAGVRACHLSAGMCMQHRRDTLKSIQDALAAGEKTVCISTQVIEAGVDISFGCVIRLAAGMDSVVQAAGRCNRNGESGSPSPVYLINCADERLRGLADIADGKTAAIALLNAYEKNPGRFGGSLSSPEAIRFYYSSLYAAMKSGYQDGYLPEHGTSLYHLLADNSGYLQGAAGAGTYLLNQAFKTAGNAFSVFREDTVEMLVPYRQGRELRTALLQADRGGHPDYTLLNQLLQEAKGYTVSLYPHQIKALTDCGGVEALFDGRVNVLLDGFYHEKTGFSLKQNDQLWEV